MKPLVITPLAEFPLVKPGDDLASLILNAVGKTGINLKGGDIFVIAQKIVSKSENRLVHLSQVNPSQKAIELAEKTEKDPRLIELVLQESREILRSRAGSVIVEHRLGFVCANAGIDHSNVSGDWGTPDEWVLLLPENPDKSAFELRKRLSEKTGLELGVLIIDSHGRAWRMGTIGTAIGTAGVPALVDQRGWQDLFGYHLKITQVGAADELAAAASLMMGQAAEGTPVVHVSGFPYPFREAEISEVFRPKEIDLFR